MICLVVESCLLARWPLHRQAGFMNTYKIKHFVNNLETDQTEFTSLPASALASAQAGRVHEYKIKLTRMNKGSLPASAQAYAQAGRVYEHPQKSTQSE